MSFDAHFFCSECSRAAGEALFGTAPPADVWILLEYNGAWGAKAPDDSNLAPEVKARIGQWMADIPRSKFAFIRRQEAERAEDAAIRLYVARVGELTPELRRLDLASYDELLGLDMAGLAQGAPEHAAALTDEMLFLVCINGKRDASCAKYGVPTLAAIRHAAPASTWGVTHIGGHRFAATLITLPDGVVYGYVDPDKAVQLVGTMRSGHVLLENLRGRSCYTEVVQAADYYLRLAHAITELPGLRLVSAETDNDTTTVQFEVLQTGRTHAVTVVAEMTDFDIFKDSTGPGAPGRQYKLIDIV